MIPEGLCSYCYKDWMNCNCDSFHPNLIKEDFNLTKNEIEALLEYFTERAGYISYEFDSEVHKIIRKMDNFVKVVNEL